MKKNEGLGVIKRIFHCTVGRSIKHAFKMMPIYKVKENDANLRRNMEEYLIKKLNPLTWCDEFVTYCQNFDFKIRRVHQKTSYERCNYESVDEKSLS